MLQHPELNPPLHAVFCLIARLLRPSSSPIFTCNCWVGGWFVCQTLWLHMITSFRQVQYRFGKGADSTWRSNNINTNFFITGVRNVLYWSKMTHMTLRKLKFRYKIEIKDIGSNQLMIRILKLMVNKNSKMHLWDFWLFFPLVLIDNWYRLC